MTGAQHERVLIDVPVRAGPPSTAVGHAPIMPDRRVRARFRVSPGTIGVRRAPGVPDADCPDEERTPHGHEQDTPPPEDYTERIVDIEVEQEMQEAFLEYAYSVIYSRALPDARTG